ncbi:MAG: hypothetical protein JNL01_05855 [Bdellovibrionales bacterium]|nr:hypothetical protein [Bdellovibrionales bacterium]
MIATSFRFQRIQGWILVLAALSVAAVSCSDPAEPGFLKFWSDDTPWRLLGGMKQNGSWDQLGRKYTQVRPLQVFQGKLYVGLVNNDHLYGEVWRFDGAEWERVAGGGEMGSWNEGQYNAVNSMAADSTYLYAGTGNYLGMATVWRFDGSTWTQIGGNNLNGSWGSNIDDVWHMTFHQGQLYAGLVEERSGQLAAPLYRYNGATWSLVTGINGENGGWNNTQGYFMAYVSLSDGTYLYSGLAGRSDHNGNFFRYDGSTFEQIGGQGIRGSWNNPEIKFVGDGIIYHSQLYVSLQGSSDPSGNRENPVWKFDGTSWSTVGNVPAEWSNFQIFNKLIEYNGKLYLSTGGAPGTATIWVLDETLNVWNKVAGHGIEGSSWHLSPGQTGTTGTQWIYKMTIFQGKLIIGMATSGYPYSAEVWGYPY